MATNRARGTSATKPAKMIKAAKTPPFMDPSARTKGVKKLAPIRVRATQVGYYDHARRREGDVFTVDASHFSEKWMERVDHSTPDRLTTAATAIQQNHDEILGTRQAARNDSVI